MVDAAHHLAARPVIFGDAQRVPALEIKLMNIDGSVMYEKTLSPPVSSPASGNAGGSSAATAKSFMWFVFLVVMATGAI